MTRVQINNVRCFDCFYRWSLESLQYIRRLKALQKLRSSLRFLNRNNLVIR